MHFLFSSPLDYRVAGLDKSYLQSINGDELRHLAGQTVTVVPQVLVFDLLNKSDIERKWDERKRCLEKLHSAEEMLWVTPAVGEMMELEVSLGCPAGSIPSLKARRIRFQPRSDSAGVRFTPSERELKAVEHDRRAIEATQPDMLSAWRVVNGFFPQLTRCGRSELPTIVHSAGVAIRDDIKMVRDFYRAMRQDNFPAPELIDSNWALFRWVQVYLLAACDHFVRYQSTVTPNRDRFWNERMDLDYTISAVLLGGLLSLDCDMKTRFRILRPDGRLLE